MLERMMSLPVLAAGVSEVGFESKFRRELSEPIAGIHFNPPVRAALLVGGFECSVVSRAVKSDQLVESIAHPGEGPLTAIYDPVGTPSLTPTSASTTKELLGDLGDSVKDVRECAAQLTRGVILGSWRRLNVCIGSARQGEDGNDQDQFSHYAEQSDRER